MIQLQPKMELENFQKEISMDAKETIVDKLSNQEVFLIDMATQIWENPQIALEETFASDLQANTLRANGFSVQQDVAEMPTAFVASWGSGSPIIGILGEYDARKLFLLHKNSLKKVDLGMGVDITCMARLDWVQLLQSKRSWKLKV